MKYGFKALKLTLSRNIFLILILCALIFLSYYFKLEQWQGAFIGIFLTYTLQEWIYLQRKLEKEHDYIKYLVDMNTTLANTIIENFKINNKIDDNFEITDSTMLDFQFDKFKKANNAEIFPKLKKYFCVLQKYIYNQSNSYYVEQLIENYYKLADLEIDNTEYLVSLNALAIAKNDEIKPDIYVESTELDADEKATKKVLQILCNISSFKYK